MAGPLSGIGQQQVPLAQPFQPGGGDQNKVVRQQEQSPERGEIQVKSAALGNSQESDTDTQKSLTAQNENSFSATQSDSGDKPRGSLVNIVV